MRIGINANINHPEAESAIRRAIHWAETSQVECWLSIPSAEKIGALDQACQLIDLPAKVDQIVVLGGDGTLLSTARAVGDRGTPILGINLGGFGFLTDKTPEELEGTLARVHSGAYQLEERMVLEAHITGETVPVFGLNDVVVEKGPVFRLIHLSLFVNDEYVCSYSADGLIIATPTGSTAYSLSVGGPIINPWLKAIIAAPVSPHSLTSRPIIFSERDVIRIVVTAPVDGAAVTVDGQVSYRLTPAKPVIVKKAAHSIKLIKFSETSFYDVLRRKLHWGIQPVARK